MKLFGVVFPKQGSQKLFAGICIQILRMKSTDLVNRCFKISSWITLTRIKPLLLNSSLQKRRVPALAFICSYASSVKRKTRNPLTFADSFCGIQNNNLYSTTNVPTKFTLQLFVRKIHENFVSGIQLHFVSCIKISFWNLRTYRNKTVRLSSV